MFDIRYENFRDENNRKIYGLKNHCDFFLDMDMDKKYQKSNWEGELCVGQKVYASLDVLVVLELFDVFVKDFPEKKPGKFYYN